MSESITLVCLGGLELRRGEDVLGASPKRLALLAYLAVARPRGPHQRDALLALFYPEKDTTRARSAFRQLLHEVRLIVGEDAITGRPREAVALNCGLVSCDACVFERAVADGEFEQALSCYSGPFLAGFHLNGCPEFEEWTEAERGRLHRAYTGTLEQLAISSVQRGDSRKAVGWWRQLLAHEPYASNVTLGLMEALAETGDRASALKAADDHATRLKQDFGAEPSRDVEAFAGRLKTEPPRRERKRLAVADRLSGALAGRYKIEELLGIGGMALVYRAQDLKHQRSVALKVLRPELAAALGPERFLQEIAISAQLNHPNILPLHDSGEADGLLYYVMPFIEGESLRDVLARDGWLPVDEALRLAREVADGLSYAHGEGVVHRDIKPENILLSRGHALVADFGVARALTVTEDGSSAVYGVALGTPEYTSPEQASGSEPVDGRTDVYSLGCVLYEMLGGTPPYTGTTPRAVLARKTTERPPGLRALRQTISEPLEAAVTRALEKAPADRYQTAEQFTKALSTSAELLTPQLQVKQRRLPAIGVLAAVLLIAVAVVLFRMKTSGPISITTSNYFQVTSGPGIEFQPAISPNGEEVAYIVGPLGSPRIVVRSASGGGIGGRIRLGEDVSGLHWLPKWTPDGGFLRFRACPQRFVARIGGDCETKEVGRFGGSARTYSVPRSAARYAWSPDGTRVAFAVGTDSIFAYSEEDDEPRLIGVNAAPTPRLPHSLAWSPDGRLIAYVNGNIWWRITTNVAPSSIWILDADGGEPVPVTDEECMNLSPQWLPDSRNLLFVSNQDGARGIYVVEVAPEGPRGPPRGVVPASDPHSISVSADGRKLAYAKFPWEHNIWSIPIPETGVVSIRDAVPVTRGNRVVMSHDVSPDGEWIVFDSNIQGELDIFKQRLAGGDPQLVVSVTGDAFDPDWSPDGTEIAFYSAESEGTGTGGEIRVVSTDGGTPEQITDSPASEHRPEWSPDGLAIAYLSQGPEATGPNYIWIISRDSVGGPWGEPVRLNDFCSWGPSWGPSSLGLLCVDSRTRTWVRVSREGEVLSRYDPATVGLPRFERPRFSPDGSRIYGFGTDQDGSEGIWWVPATGGRATKVVAFDDPSVIVFPGATVGPDHLYLTIASYESDIWVMDLEW